jgi:PIN domain nuclease of toxin-antitoxin system
VKLLLDTHLLLRAAGGPARLKSATRRLLEDPRLELLFSAASIREVAIKMPLGRADLEVDPRLLRRTLLDSGYTELPVTGAHAAAMLDRAALHRNPFGRLLSYPGPIRRI